jgi:hypothetical protein
VFDGQLLRARLWSPGDAARVVYVTFRQRVAEPGRFDDTGPVQHALEAGMAHLHLQSRWNDWYLNDETQALEAALAPVRARFDRAQALGYSMGGYAALRLSGALGLDRAVVISPQFTLDPARVPQDRRYVERQSFDAVRGDLARHARRGLAGVVVFDPFRPLDRLHAGLIRGLLADMQAAPLPFGGHPATGVIGEARGFGQLQAITMQPAPQAGDIVRLHRRLRSGSARYWQNLAVTCERGGKAQLARQAVARAEHLADGGNLADAAD